MARIFVELEELNILNFQVFNSYETTVAYKPRESTFLKGTSRYLNSFPTISSTSLTNKILELYRPEF